MKRLGLIGVALAMTAAPAMAQERHGSKDGFTLKPGSARIVLMRPSISVGAQSTGGLAEPNADWTDQARANLGHALAAQQQRLGNAVVDYVEPADPAEARRVAEYRALFSSVAQSVIDYQFFIGNRLPTKKRLGSFVWSIGPEVKTLPGLADADYALFITNDDAYGSTGRKVLQVLAAFGNVAVKSGEHKGFAGLIDLRTGELVWLNADLAMGGDVRTPAGAEKRVGELLAGFPGRAPDPATAGATVN